MWHQAEHQHDGSVDSPLWGKHYDGRLPGQLGHLNKEEV